MTSFHGLMSTNPDMLDIFDVVRNLGDSDIPVLVQGSTGVGKSLLARAIHASSSRANQPFITVSCGTIPDALMESELLGHVRGSFTGAEADRVGLFSQAHGGTIYLDEVADMSEEMQTKLLRVLEDGRIRPLGGKDSETVDVRVVSSVTERLEKLVRDGRFRGDLYFRLKGVVLDLPDLADRWEDIPGLAAHFARLYAEDSETPPRLFDETLQKLSEYGWPGNVRELENELRRLAALGIREIAPSHLAPSVARGRRTRSGRRPVEPLESVVARAERGAIENALLECGGNKSRAANRLGITRKALYRRLVKYGMSGSDPMEDTREGETISPGESPAVGGTTQQTNEVLDR